MDVAISPSPQEEEEEWIERNADESIDAEIAEGDSPVLADD